MSNYLNYYEIQHLNTDFEDLIHYLQDAVKEGNLQITKEVVDTIIEITKNKELNSDDKDRYYDEGYEDGEKEGKEDGYADGYDDGYLDGYEKGNEENQEVDIKKIKQEIEDEYYLKGYISTDVYYQKLVPNRESNFDKPNDIAPDDLPF